MGRWQKAQEQRSMFGTLYSVNHAKQSAVCLRGVTHPDLLRDANRGITWMVMTHMHMALSHPGTHPSQLTLTTRPPCVHLPRPCQDDSVVCPCIHTMASVSCLRCLHCNIGCCSTVCQHCSQQQQTRTLITCFTHWLKHWPEVSQVNTAAQRAVSNPSNCLNVSLALYTGYSTT